MRELLVIFGLSLIIIGIILLASGVFNGKDKNNSNLKVKNSDLDDPDEIRKKYNLPPTNYILPAEFSLGFLEQDKPKFMNNCSPNVLYPIQGLGPDYGWKMPKDCRCTEFVQAP